MNSNYKLDFTIPQGPTGPTGPANGANAYGGRYSNEGSSIAIASGTSSVVPTEHTMPQKNVTYATANTITVPVAGVYKIDYMVNASASVAGLISVSVRNDGLSIPGTIISRTLSVGTGNLFNGSVIVNLAANSNLDLAVSSLLALNVTLGSGTNAYLVVTRLN